MAPVASQKGVAKRKHTDKENGPPQISEYEKQRLENIKRNNHHLDGLGLGDAKLTVKKPKLSEKAAAAKKEEKLAKKRVAIEARIVDKAKYEDEVSKKLSLIKKHVEVPASIFGPEYTIPEVRPACPSVPHLRHSPTPPTPLYPHRIHRHARAPSPPAPLLTTARRARAPTQCGFWVGKVDSCVDKFSNYWIKVKGEEKFYRPVEEVATWRVCAAPATPPPAAAEPPPAAVYPAGAL